VAERVVYRPVRRKLPDERRSITHKFSIGGHEGYITVGMYDDGAPGEIFITMANWEPHEPLILRFSWSRYPTSFAKREPGRTMV
jgi:hypothetical protein